MNDEELTPQQKIDRARHAVDLLYSDVMASAWTAIKERLTNIAIREASATEREAARAKLLLIDEVVRELEAFIADGELEADRRKTAEAKAAATAG